MKLAIIGTAGRREDRPKLTLHHWKRMCDAAKAVIDVENVTSLVSGGAAWADHVAVEISVEYRMQGTIWLPADPVDLSITKHHHRNFSRVRGLDTWEEVENSGLDTYRYGSFKHRNAKVAAEADLFLAMTFGEGPHIKTGGTAHTARLMISRGLPGYHLDLNSLTLWREAHT